MAGKPSKEVALEKLKGWREELKTHQDKTCDCSAAGRCALRQETLKFEIKRMINRFK